MNASIIIPSPHEEERLRGDVADYDVVKIYRRAYEEEHAGERWLEDTKGWYHDPEWRERTMSIQHIHEVAEFKQFDPFWLMIGALLLLAQIWRPLLNVMF
jgi:hypothetical protein